METLTPTTQENLNSILIDILKGAKGAGAEIYATSKAGLIKAVDFAQDQAPLVVQEFLKWKMLESVVYLVAGLIVIGILGYIIKRMLNARTEEKKEDNDADCFGYEFTSVILSIICGILFFSMIVPQTLRIVKISVAPRVYLIEYASDLYKGNKR